MKKILQYMGSVVWSLMYSYALCGQLVRGYDEYDVIADDVKLTDRD
jgi:hypothetical protein